MPGLPAVCALTARVVVEELKAKRYRHRRYTCDDPEGHRRTFAAPRT